MKTPADHHPQGYVEDILLYDLAEAYKYIRLTEADAENDYIVIGGCDHKVGQEDPEGQYCHHQFN